MNFHLLEIDIYKDFAQVSDVKQTMALIMYVAYSRINDQFCDSMKYRYSSFHPKFIYTTCVFREENILYRMMCYLHCYN